MLKLVKGIFDVRAKWEHRGRASWSKLLLAFFVVQAQNRSERPGHGFPGSGRSRIRLKVSTSSAYWEGKSAMATSLEKSVWTVLRLVLIRKGPTRPGRPLYVYRGLILQPERVPHTDLNVDPRPVSGQNHALSDHLRDVVEEVDHTSPLP